jgi:MHS family proline/betaine transporter-like MFS transporter
MSAGLTRQQKEAVSLLSIGTFLEYFDLMLYAHMAVLLNELFFPQSNPLITQLLAAFTFCSTFILRPIGGFLIGWVGDRMGRKFTIVITTTMMAASCIAMASIGTYAEIGITASIVVIICRMLQGFSSLGEVVGATLYITETSKSPYMYTSAGIINICSRLGGLFALIAASFALSMQLNWRIAFWIGAVIAVVGLFARITLRETPEFIDFKSKIKIKTEQNKQSTGITTFFGSQDKINKKAALAYFAVRFIGPICFYITYMYMGDFMKASLEMTAMQVIKQNLKVSILTIVGTIITVCFVKKYHPIRITKIYSFIFCLFLPFLPYWLGNISKSNLFSLVCLQFMTYFLILCQFGIDTVYFRYFPVAKRFTVLATVFGISAALSYTVVSFGLIPLVKYFGYYGLWGIYVPAMIGFLWGVNYIEKLEKEKGRYFNYPQEKLTHKIRESHLGEKI